MSASFASLPAHERQAFFSLLDEYFQSRPHLMPGAGSAEEEEAAAAAPTPSASAAPPSTASRSQPPPPAARKPASSLAHSIPRAPSGLSTGKTVGRIDMSSKGAAFGSMIMGKPRAEAPATAGEAISGASPPRTSNSTSRAAPPPAPALRTTPAPAPDEPEFGQAEVVYDYNGTELEDLSVKRFEIIDLIEKVSDDWWKARATDGRTGIVPSTYVKQI